jgi:hypothetical protein
VIAHRDAERLTRGIGTEQPRGLEPRLTSGLRREVLLLVGFVLALDVIFVLVYFLAHVRTASDAAKLGFTVIWTLAILVVAARGLSKIRQVRLRSAGKGRPT